MEKYVMIKLEDNLSKKELVEKYNELVEYLWFLEFHLKEANEELDVLYQAYEEISNELYG